MERRGDIDDETAADEVFGELADLLVDTARELRARAAQRVPVVPLTQTQSQVMRYIHLHPGCSASDIADGSGLQRANVSAALGDLRRLDYIVSRRDETDGRAIRIEATPRADATIAALRRSWAAVVEEAWRSAAPEDATPVPPVVTEALNRILAGLGADRATKAFAAGPPSGGASGADSTVRSEPGALDRAPALAGSPETPER